MTFTEWKRNKEETSAISFADAQEGPINSIICSLAVAEETIVDAVEELAAYPTVPGFEVLDEQKKYVLDTLSSHVMDISNIKTALGTEFGRRLKECYMPEAEGISGYENLREDVMKVTGKL